MEKRLKLLIISVLVLFAVSVWALFFNKNDNEDSLNHWDVPDKVATNSEAHEVVYLIFPASQNTTKLEITEVVREPDSSNLLASGFEADYKDYNSAEDPNITNSSSDTSDSSSNITDTDDSSNDSSIDSDDTNQDSSDDTTQDNADDTTQDSTDDTTQDKPDDTTQDNADDTTQDNPDDTTIDDNPIDDTPVDNIPTTPPMTADQTTGSPIAAMYLKYASSSSGNLDYILYVPANANANTPIFMFLHGNGEVGKDMEKALTRYAFLQDLKDGSWQPGCIIICPIAKKKSHWKAEVANLNIIIDEVTTNYGGSRSNMYLSGASAGADAMTKIAEQIPFKGAIYMAGHMNGNGAYNVDSFLSLWAGKQVYYYRDNLAGGGYGYSKAFVDSCIAKAPQYGVTFTATDLNWNHSVGLVDATFLPSGFIDKNGRACHNGLGKLIFGQ